MLGTLDVLSTVTVAVGIAIVIGIAGVVVPMMPGTALIVAAVVVWSLVAQSVVGWWVAGICVAVALSGWSLQYLVPGRRLKTAGVPNRTLILGAVAGVVGFFVIPVAGLPIGFVLGVAVAELARLRTWERAWPSTKHAVKAALLSYGIELAAAVIMAIVWVVGVQRVLF